MTREEAGSLANWHIDGGRASPDGSRPKQPCRLAHVDQLRPISVQIETGRDARVETAVATLFVREVDQAIPILKRGERGKRRINLHAELVRPRLVEFAHHVWIARLSGS